MRTVKRTGAFKLDYKRVCANPKHRNFELPLIAVLKLLLEDALLSPKALRSTAVRRME